MKYLAFIFPLAFLLFACQDDIITYNDGYDNGLTPSGPPAIEKIILTSDTTSLPTVIEGANLSDMITIYGQNLSQVQSIFFNDISADLKTVYAVNSRIIVPVPRVLPNEINNKLVVTTSKGTTTVDFNVSIPKLIVTGLENEFSAPGDTVFILGNNFDLYDVTKETGTVKIGSVELEIFASSETSLKVVIPEGTPDNTTITIGSPSVEESISIKFRDAGIALQTYEGQWGGWVEDLATDGSNPGDPKPLFGIDKFTRLTADLAAWDWDPGRIYGGGFNLADADVVTNPENYSLKFELYTSKAISVGNFFFQGPTKPDYEWNPVVGGISLDTNKKWKTLTFNLKEVAWSLNDNSWNSFGFVYQPQEATSVDFSIANIRIVKNN